MTAISYRTNDLPPGNPGAFCPVPAADVLASSWGLVTVHGSPGTEVVPAPAPQRTWAPSLTRSGPPDTAQGSSVAPDVILPAIYTAGVANMGPEHDTGLGMARRRMNELPVRASNPARLPVPAMMQFPAGGRSVLPWPRAFQRWPIRGQDRRSGSN